MASIDDAKKKPTYYSGFLFDGISDPEELHVTHKYFGELKDEDAVRVLQIIDDYFKEPRKFPRCVFDQREMFGPDKDVPVLTPKEFDPDDFFPDLKKQLDEFRKDDFDYHPHTTTKLEIVDLPFSGYFLCYDSEVVQVWPSDPSRAEVAEWLDGTVLDSIDKRETEAPDWDFPSFVSTLV
jgi:hypothetical protein